MAWLIISYVAVFALGCVVGARYIVGYAVRERQRQRRMGRR